MVVFIRHRRLHLGALFFVTRFQGFVNDLVGQIVGQLCQFVGIKVFHRRQQLFLIHGFDKGFAHRVRHFKQDFAVFLGRGQMPNQHPLFLRQRFEHRRHVGRVQLAQNRNQLDQITIEFRRFNRAVFFNLLVNRQQRFRQLVNTRDVQRQAVEIDFGIVGVLWFDAHKYSARLSIRARIQAGLDRCVGSGIK